MSTADKYVIAAYIVVLVAVLAYVVIISAKLARMERQLEELEQRAGRQEAEQAPEREPLRVG